MPGNILIKTNIFLTCELHIALMYLEKMCLCLLKTVFEICCN